MREVTAYESRDGSLHRSREEADYQDRVAGRAETVKRVTEVIEDYVLEKRFKVLDRSPLSESDRTELFRELAELVVAEWENLSSAVQRA